MTQSPNLILFTNVKPDICATCGIGVISSVSNYILLEMALFSEHLQTDGSNQFDTVTLYTWWLHLP